MLVMVWSETHCIGGRRKIPSKSFSEDIVQEIISFPRQALHAASLALFTQNQTRLYILKPPCQMIWVTLLKS